MSKERTPLELKLSEVSPAIIVARLSDDTTKTFRPSAHTRKRWLGVLRSLEQLDWTQLEMSDAKGQILEIFHNPDASPKAERIDVNASFARSEIREMIMAQREALTWQDKGVRAALDTCINVMREMSLATQSVIEMYKTAERERKQMIRELESAIVQRGGEELPSDGIVAALAPALLGRLLEGAAPAPNGAKVKTPVGD